LSGGVCDKRNPNRYWLDKLGLGPEIKEKEAPSKKRLLEKSAIAISKTVTVFGPLEFSL